MTDLITVSSLEKVLPKLDYTAKQTEKITVLKGEEGAYQIAFKDIHKTKINISIESDIREYITVYSVGCVPVMLTSFEDALDDPDYISNEPGIFPDILKPIENSEIEANGWYQSLWIKADRNAPEGIHKIVIKLSNSKEIKSCELTYEVLPIQLPESDLIFTQWFHSDCLASCYKVPVWSEEHWSIVEKFIKTAADYGVNMILTPVFTPPLDTEVGGERPTVQLVKIKRDKGKYFFDFSLLERWVKICLDSGIKYFEIAHLFTQWGAEFTPKIIAEENGEEKRIFGWDVPAGDAEYDNFLSQFLPELTEFFKKRGLFDRVYFHISDEPNGEQLESYLAAKNVAVKYLKDCKIIDALSEFEFYEKGIVEIPVVQIDHINPFIGKSEALWGYYCCVQGKGVSNRFIAMPSARNRYIALQMYKYKLTGFLQWGYNFYYAQYSKREINPFLENDSGGAFPAGDSFSVYPGENGPIESLRLIVFYQALQDLAVMKLLEKYIGYDEVLKIIEGIAGNVIFDKCTSDPEVVLNIRNAVNERLRKIISQ